MQETFLRNDETKDQLESLDVVRQHYHRWMRINNPDRRMSKEHGEQLLSFLSMYCKEEVIEAVKVGTKIDVHDGDAVTVVETEFVCIYILGWMRDMGIQWHDHGDCDALVHVVVGEVPNTLMIGPATTRTTIHQEGETLYLPAPGLHKMGYNPDPYDGVSIHLYTGPNCGLDTMKLYVEGSDGCPELDKFDIWNRDKDNPLE